MFEIIKRESPNFSSRNGLKPSILVLHYTGMKSSDEALERLCDKRSEVSSHYVIDENGKIFQLVDENNCAWHAGVSYWRGNKNINNISIGIEIVNTGHEFGYVPFPQIQMESVLVLSKNILNKYNIEAVNVVGHSDVAPLRKSDPGELFDWKFLAKNGVGNFPIIKKHLFAKEESLIKNLSSYGYEIPHKKEDLQKIIIAFQRHFRQSNINGLWDDECESILAELLQMV
ncbi:MAG: N-acetylmuramoyl-L-alanine amidase [Pseudomonadota bacterium]